MNNTNNIHNMKSIILALLVAMLSFNSYAQTKTGTDMKQEINKATIPCLH